ncbi:MAG: GyrI-like domain-containing protein [Mesorhizobium sp.]|nr:GyrI-like domain-containing protein [Mesorhizobium sp.]MCO5162978.1 GyrI-like domain-containing protein [Mesorhizobium sp.]
MVDKVDFKKSMKALYAPPVGRFVQVEVPPLSYLMIDGSGDPNTAASYRSALEWLYSVSYPLKFMSKKELGRDYAVMPLEGLWWADDMSTFLSRKKDEWSWTMMILQPDWIGQAMVDAAIAKARAKLGEPPASLRLERLEEGLCVQTMHIGSYDDEGPVLAKLHDEYLPQHGLKETGRHHEIYLGDPRKTAPEKLKTILRQPVQPAR